MCLLFKFFIFGIIFIQTASAQTVSSYLPAKIAPKEKYLFYLHGAVVTLYGNNAVNDAAPEWGPYEYANILDSLKQYGFNIISENRKKEIPDSFYTEQLRLQVDSLLAARVPVKNITVVGASSGWDIALRASAKIKNPKLKFVLMGGCWPNTYKDYSGIKLYGRFLSIIEKSDPHGSCTAIFTNRENIKEFRELVLNTGLSHGFFYKAREAWVAPVVAWANGRKYQIPSKH